ncbi:MAG: radical SAM family heme chaperone HemW, partial [Desulfovermiculus sp.]
MHLYVHIPFCRRKCSYCGFASAPPGPGDVEDYIRAVIREMQLQSPKVQGRRVQTLFLGGGTPSMLSLVHVQRLLDAVRQYFALDNGAEITLEANPDSVHTSNQVRALRDMGITRISLGVQSLDRDILHFLGRTHSPEKAAEAVNCLGQGGMDNWGLDLIWGIPGQDVQSWQRSLEEVVAWDPAHLSLYSLCIEPDTPLARREWEHGLDWPGEDTWEKMFLHGRKLLLQAGFVHYEI